MHIRQIFFSSVSYASLSTGCLWGNLRNLVVIVNDQDLLVKDISPLKLGFDF